MKKLTWAVFGATLVAAGLTALVEAQIPRSDIYTTPLPPPREVLDRLNLQMSWAQYVPMDGRRDGLATIQMRGTDVYVQTRSGLIALLDADTGVVRWRNRVGIPYRVTHGLAFNSREVYAVNNTYLYALDRRTGGVRWQYRLREGIAAPPIADERFIFIPTQTGRFTAFLLPQLDLEVAPPEGLIPGVNIASTQPAKRESEEERYQRIVSVRGDPRRSTGSVSSLTSAREASAEELGGAMPVRVWEEVASLRLEFPPLYTRDRLLLPTPGGVVLALAKIPKESGIAAEIYRFSTDSPIVVPAGGYEDMAYIGAQDANLYALEVSNGHLLWRFTTGTPIIRQPAVTDQDVYVVAQRNGLIRVDRATGQPMWRIPLNGQFVESNAAADRFLAVNPKYVYAADRSGRLLILDRRRGIQLSNYDVHDFVFPITNEVTDRLYLAANNGLIVCLHDRDYPAPVRHRKREEDADNPVRLRLADPVTMQGIPKIKLRELLDKWSRDYPVLKFRINEDAFQKAMAESPAAKEVKLLPVDGKPLGDVLQSVLDQVKGVYQVIDDIVWILPDERRAE
jgi:outer membrane protein assembly factor BamB